MGLVEVHDRNSAGNDRYNAKRQKKARIYARKMHAGGRNRNIPN